MAKRGRPTVEEKGEKFLGNPQVESLLIQCFTTGNSKRSQTNAFYSYLGYSFLEAASKFPEEYTVFYEEIKHKRCITEQLGRMIVQDEYDPGKVVRVARTAAKKYHEGHTAKNIAAHIKNIRKTGRP